MMKRIFILICLLLFVQSIFADQVSWEEFYNQSFNYFYNGEYERTIECLEKAKELNSENPVVYWRLTFIFVFKIETSETFDKTFNGGMAICETLFYIGVFYGNRVLFKRALGKRNRSMLKDINKSREYLRKIKKTEDFYYEALGYLGTFNYGPILMSRFQELKAKLAGYKWDLKKGLQQLKDAMKPENSRYSDDTKFIYKGILMELVKKKKYRNRVQEAIDLVESLLKKYPRNSFLKKDLETLKKIL